MKKTLRILSIAAAALQLLSLLVFAVAVLFQRQLKPLFAVDPEVIAHFQFPVVSALTLLLATLIIAALAAMICFLKPNKVVLPELIGVIALALLLPLFQVIGARIELSVVERFGTTFTASYVVLNTLASYALSFSKIASSLAFVVCGMSFALKKLTVRKPRA